MYNVIREVEVTLLYVSRTITAKTNIVEDCDNKKLIQITILDSRFSKLNPEEYIERFACFQFDDNQSDWLAGVMTNIIAKAISTANDNSKHELHKRVKAMAELAGIQL